jgi:SMODS-associated and fused to various effectors sensor domain
MTRATISRAASGARILGDDVQHLIAWYHVLRTQRADSTITELAVEADGVGNVDDLTLHRSAGPAEYWQVKASVDATSPLTEAWLFDQANGKASLLQRLHRSWLKLRSEHELPPKVVLATTKAIDPSDPVLGARATTDARIVETLRDATGPLAEARMRWAEHLAVDEAALLEFLGSFEIRHSLSEAEWREKVQDAAAGARVRTNLDAVTLGIQQVRDWVKAPRQAFSPVELKRIIAGLGLVAQDRRPLVVVQVMEHNQRPDATYSVDWTDLFEDGDPRERRQFHDPEDARQRVAADLAVARQRLRSAGIHDIEVVGPMRLPLWFTVGANFSSTAGFVVSARARDGIWTSNTAPGCQRDLEIRLPEIPPTDPIGRPWAVSVSFATDIAEDVNEFLEDAVPDAYHLRARLPEPGRAALGGLPHAQAVIFKLRDELRALRRSLRPPEAHLFLAMPGACALLLGNAWDRMPPTWTYWDLGVPGRYERAVKVGN